MRAWLLPLGGLIVWTIHFFLIYGLASLAPGTALARIATVIATAVCMAAGMLLIWHLVRQRRVTNEALDDWLLNLGLLGAAISVLAIIWQGLPPLLT